MVHLHAQNRGRLLLILGAVLGLAFGMARALGLFQATSVVGIPNDRVAIINERDIRRVDYLRALKMLDSDKREALTEADTRLVLERMIEEELLLQYGLEQEITRQPEIRQLVLKAVLENVMNDITARRPNEQQLLDFYRTEIQPQTGIKPELVNGQLSPEWQEALNELWVNQQQDKRLRQYTEDLRVRANIRLLNEEGADDA